MVVVADYRTLSAIREHLALRIPGLDLDDDDPSATRKQHRELEEIYAELERRAQEEAKNKVNETLN